MRLKQILLSLLAIALFANCTKNSSLEGNLEGDQSFAGVSIKFPKMVSKAVTEDPNATAEEQAVTT